MNRIVLLTFLLTGSICFCASAKITEYQTTKKDWKLYGQVKTIGPAKATLEYIVNSNDTSFLLMMWDERPELKTYFTIRFNSNGTTLSTFYNILMSFFEKENWKNNDYVRFFKLGNEEVSVYKTVIIGTKTIILKTSKGRIALRKGEIEKLFGRK